MTATILVAEDSKVVRAMLRQRLELHGFNVIEAVDGGDAIRVCRISRPDVILLDVMMPVLDGYGALRVIQADPEISDIPVVFLTARSSTEDVVEGLRLGAHDYLSKPFQPAELIARVSAALRVKLLTDQLRERNKELDRVTRTDALTGLYNRRHLEERLGQIMSAARRSGRAVSVLMCDLDGFKAINDTRGHNVGDTVLRVIGERLRREVRAEDVAGRWGGEEFLVILEDTAAVDAVVVAERIRSCIGNEPIEVAGEAPVQVTVSIGRAAGTRDGEELVRRADAALYDAKAAGRNRVMSATEEASVR